MKREFANNKTVDEKEHDTKLTLRSSSDVYRVDHSLRIEVFQKWVWVIEKRIPVAVASDLIHCFVRLTTQTDKNYKDRVQLQLLIEVDEPALFAVQLLHRRTVRTVVQSSFPMKSVKIFQVNVAGYVHPLQHMRGPNENVIEMARPKVRESIQALEVLLECKSAVRIPIDACFDLIDIKNGLVPYVIGHKATNNTQRSYLLERPNGSAQFKCQTCLLHSFEPEILLQTITELDNAKLLQIFIELFPPSIMQSPVDQSLNMIMNTNHLLGQLIHILHEKVKQAKLFSNHTQSCILLSQAIDILSRLHHQDILSIGQVVKYLHYDRLLFDLTESISKQTFLDNENNLWEKCQSFLKEKNHSDNDVNTDLVRVALAYALSRNEMKFIQSLIQTGRRTRFYLDLAEVFARLLNNESQLQIRPELVRGLWDRILDILSDKLQGPGGVKQQSRNRHQQSNTLNDKLSVVDLQKFLINIHHPILIQIIFSLSSRLYSLILVEQSHVDIYSEYSRY
ncbi:unnamed protein product [Rotaria socialis]|uniref:INTS8 TPR repeats domain-containing protein n=1 Tax=Rotaria socialis TaxID=392032 RepID=A0A821BIR8_9BILA|nr:unnamed protein product [Rotaria socialis]CAF4596166.1 unnamed protein product [Rotaria socialis]